VNDEAARAVTFFDDCLDDNIVDGDDVSIMDLIRIYEAVEGAVDSYEDNNIRLAFQELGETAIEVDNVNADLQTQ